MKASQRKKGQRNSQEEDKESLMTMLWSRHTGQAIQTKDGERQRVAKTYAEEN